MPGRTFTIVSGRSRFAVECSWPCLTPLPSTSRIPLGSGCETGSTNRRMLVSHPLWRLKALAVGAGLMYLLDPKHGAERRTRLRRSLVQCTLDVADELDRLAVEGGHLLGENARALTGSRPRPSAAAASPASARRTSLSPATLASIAGATFFLAALRRRAMWACALCTIGLVSAISRAISTSPPRNAPDREELLRSGQPTAADTPWKVASP